MQRPEYIRLFQRFQNLREQSLTLALRRGLKKIGVYLSFPFAKQNLGRQTFKCLDKTYPYFVHTYNETWRNERAVEIPLLLEFIKNHSGKRILELGNVAKYYDPEAKHDVIDKYEKSPGVINEDFIHFNPESPYDAFCSVSTFEHIGWDEVPKEIEKIYTAFQHIPNVVNNCDHVFISVPLGYNSKLDELIREKKIRFKRQNCLMRVDQNNRWVECSVENALKTVYGRNFVGANALFFGFGWEKS